MGMFDYVKCEMKLPNDFIYNPADIKDSFQTKGFNDIYKYSPGGTRSLFIIHEDGSLSVEWANYGPMENGEILYDDYITDEIVAGNFEYPNEFDFYTSIGKYGSDDYKWVEFKAFVANKKVIDIIEIKKV